MSSPAVAEHASLIGMSFQPRPVSPFIASLTNFWRLLVERFECRRCNHGHMYLTGASDTGNTLMPSCLSLPKSQLAESLAEDIQRLSPSPPAKPHHQVIASQRPNSSIALMHSPPGWPHQAGPIRLWVHVAFSLLLQQKSYSISTSVDSVASSLLPTCWCKA